jgi:hypothetical protein
MLTQDLLSALFEYQPDGRLLRTVTTNPRAKAHTYSGCVNKAGYLRTRVLGKLYYNHHLVWFLHHGTWPSALDHINGDKADNRLENLRICSPQQNMHNARKRSDSGTGVKGVNWRAAKNKFRARIVVDRKEISLGHYDTLEEAQQAVTQARTKYHGEFARHD